jgi:predicted TPR repeat methyltransferase
LVSDDKVLSIMEPTVKQIFQQAITARREGEFEEAAKLYQKIVASQPNFPEAHNNLGDILFKLKRIEEAELSFRKAIELKVNFAEAHKNLGTVLLHLRKLDEAKVNFQKAIELKPDYAGAYCSLGNLLNDLGRFDEAEASYRKALEIKPNYAEVHHNLGIIHKTLGNSYEAKISFQKALEFNSDLVESKHFLSALDGVTPNTAPRKYIEKLFDRYALNFENSLNNSLDYKAPKAITELILRDSLNVLLGSVLDLGCGTGLFGNEIKQHCSNLEGVDLSEAMLEKARAKNIYDKLKKQDIIDYLLKEDLDFDYFVSVDVFNYIGELTEIFRLIKSRNNTKGKFIFSTEHTDKDGFFLEKTGRYSHSKRYIENLCKRFNYKLSCFEKINLRKENKKSVIGSLYLLDF